MSMPNPTFRARTSPATRVLTAIPRSPLHRLLSGQRLLPGFTGRRSGTRHATPVNHLQRDHELATTTDSRWWRNPVGDAPAEVVLRGQRLTGRTEPIHEPGTPAEAPTALTRHHPPTRRRAHIGLDAPAQPDPDDVVRAEIARGRVPIRITPPENTP